MAASLPVCAARFGAFRVLVAVLAIAMRLLAPGLPAPGGSADAGDGLAVLAGGLVICHAGGGADGPATDQAPAAPAGHTHECLLCPACHMAGQAALPAPDRVPVPAAPVLLTGLAALLPPATGPPHFARVAARPTGPPDRFV